MKTSKKIMILLIFTFMTVGAMISVMEWKKGNADLNIAKNLMIKGQKIDGYPNPYIDDGGIYLPYDVVKNYIDEDISIDENGKRIFINLVDKNLLLEDNGLTDFMKESKIGMNIPTRVENGTIYVPVSLLSKIFEIDIHYDDHNDTVMVNALERKEPLNKKREPFHTNNPKINIVWEYVHEKSPKLSDEGRINALDVIVPTWFSIVNDKGTIINNGDKSYVEEAHKKGYKVWGLVNNSFDPRLTSTILNNKELRKKVIGQLVLYASLYDLDGINIDFENMYYEDKESFVKFVEETRAYAKKQNLVLSVDITVPSSSERWSKVYDREKLGKIVDYVAIMTYDEHWATSPVSGSVASIGWVERGIEKSLKSIPAEKVLLGLPFYTRKWKEYKDESGKIKIESKAISMTAARKIVDEKDAVVLWNEEAGQYYAQYNEDDAVCKIWLEDPRSIALKVGLVEKYDLAGTAAWRRGFEDIEVWMVLQKIIKDGKKYAELGFYN